MKIIDKLLENPLHTSFDIEPFIHCSMKEMLSELELPIDGLISPEQAEKLKVFIQHCEDLAVRKAGLEN